jgi:hypothetical protein
MVYYEFVEFMSFRTSCTWQFGSLDHNGKLWAVRYRELGLVQ